MLYRNVDHLTSAVHPVVRIDAVWAECATVHGIFRELWLFEAIGSSAETTATFGLLTFWISHFSKVLCSGSGVVLRKERLITVGMWPVKLMFEFS
jgi:hypothetical protein